MCFLFLFLNVGPRSCRRADQWFSRSHDFLVLFSRARGPVCYQAVETLLMSLRFPRPHTHTHTLTFLHRHSGNQESRLWGAQRREEGGRTAARTPPAVQVGPCLLGTARRLQVWAGQCCWDGTWLFQVCPPLPWAGFQKQPLTPWRSLTWWHFPASSCGLLCGSGPSSCPACEGSGCWRPEAAICHCAPREPAWASPSFLGTRWQGVAPGPACNGTLGGDCRARPPGLNDVQTQ